MKVLLGIVFILSLILWIMVLAFTPPSTLNASSADYEPVNCILLLISSIALLLTTIAWGSYQPSKR